MRATKGIARIASGTIVAVVPVARPTSRRDNGKTTIMSIMNGMERRTLMVREYEGRYLLYVVRKFDESMDETFENTIISGRIINEKQLRKEFGKEPK
jgi:hypothetical protein